MTVLDWAGGAGERRSGGAKGRAGAARPGARAPPGTTPWGCPSGGGGQCLHGVGGGGGVGSGPNVGVGVRLGVGMGSAGCGWRNPSYGRQTILLCRLLFQPLPKLFQQSSLISLPQPLAARIVARSAHGLAKLLQEVLFVGEVT